MSKRRENYWLKADTYDLKFSLTSTIGGIALGAGLSRLILGEVFPDFQNILTINTLFTHVPLYLTGFILGPMMSYQLTERQKRRDGQRNADSTFEGGYQHSGEDEGRGGIRLVDLDDMSDAEKKALKEKGKNSRNNNLVRKRRYNGLRGRYNP